MGENGKLREEGGVGVELRESFFYFLLKQIDLTCVLSAFLCAQGKLFIERERLKGMRRKPEDLFLVRKDSLAFEIGWREDKDGYRFIYSSNSSY